MAQDFTYVRNHSKESLPVLGGFFRSIPIFTRMTYLEPYTGMQHSIESRTFRLDIKGIGGCYNTAAGVGILGVGADTAEKRRGFHPVWLLVIVGAILYFLFKAPDVVAGRMVNSNLVKKSVGLKGESYSGGYTNGVPETQLDFRPARPTNSQPASALQPVVSKPVLPAGIPERIEQIEEKPVYLAGFAKVGTKATVEMDPKIRTRS